VIERDWPGYRSQKQFAVDAASNDWVLVLDADEQLSPALATEIATLGEHDVAAVGAFDAPRLSRYFGRYLRHGDWYPDRQVRLFDRRRARFAGLEVHERVDVDGRLGHLRGDILHDSFRNLDDQLAKRATYARLVAEQQHARGKRGSWLKVFLNPLWRFLRGYVFRLGFLEGWRGLAVALIGAKYVREKHLRLLILDRVAREARRAEGRAGRLR
jgi:glycosyltransferase involved in cell wall biosynthesis